MTAPIRPQRHASASHPLAVADVRLDYPEGFSPGDPYFVDIVLNRSLDPYEDRTATYDVKLPGFKAEYDRLRTRKPVDEIDPDEIRGFLHELNAQAAERRQEAAEEMGNLDAHAERLKGVLRPKS